MSMQMFFDSMHEKFLLRATGECHVCEGKGGQDTHVGFGDDWIPCDRCNGTGKENRSLEPWKDYDLLFLRNRMLEEINEYESCNMNSEDAADELLDIANFAAFLWIKWKEGKA